MRQNVDYAALFAAVPSPCLVMMLDMTIVAVNQAYLDLCGRRREELLGRRVLDPPTHDRADPRKLTALRNLEASLRRVRATGEPDVMAPQKYGTPILGSAHLFEERYWSTINFPVLGPSGAAVLFVHRTDDVTAFIRQRQRQRNGSRVSGPGAREEEMRAQLDTRTKELRKLDQQVREAKADTERLLDRQRQFTADASHELRTPLAALRVQVEAAQLHPDDIDLPDLLNHLTDDLDRLEDIITDLLLLSRLEADFDRTLEEVDLTGLVRTEAARWVESHDVRLGLDPEVTVKGTSTHIVRLLAHLLENARRHATRRVEVDLRRAGDHAELTVADDGEGVSPADRERIFQRFVRLDTARSRHRGGTGLGLAIARDIASAHHGTLHVEDSADGGARFVLRIPLVH
ncbi:sensor histidine kinase [Nonomuraea sp. 3N208]|uniref:sensor histidine kinase n=1 Tax=Nonomuraea sp. 3N208 TaxID=3457421 RepID=UPI003FD46666